MSCGLERGGDCKKRARLAFLLLLNERPLLYKGMRGTAQNEKHPKLNFKAILNSPL